MSKLLVTAAAIVGGVALAATGFGLAVDATVGLAGTATIAGASVSTIATVASIASAGLSFLGELTAKKPSNVGAPTEWKADPDAGMDMVFGDAPNGGHIIYRQAYGKKNKYQTIVTHWSVGPVHSIDTTYVDGIAQGVVGQIIQVADRGNLYQNTQLGLCPEPGVLTVAPVAPFGWTDQHKLSGKAAIINTLVFDAKGSVTFTSTPGMLWRGKGMLCYDARKDSTYPGGSGPHRINDETTREWSDNPFVVGHTYCLGWHQNGKLTAGVGLTTGIITAMFVEGANVCDANGWKCGGVKSTTDDKWDTLKDILQAGGGEPIRLGSQLGCIVKTPRVSLATIDKHCLAKGKIVVPTANARRDRINTVSPRYWLEQAIVTEDSDDNLVTTTTWAQVTGAPIAVDAYVAADGRSRRKAVDYPLVQCFAGAQPNQVAQLARYDIEDARELPGISLPLKLRWMGYKPGDVVTINLPEAGLSNQDILLLNRELEPSSSIVTMTARTETAAKHAFALGQTTVAPSAPSVAVPDFSLSSPSPGIWTAIGATLSSATGAIPAIIVALAPGVTSDTLADELAGVDAIIVEYRREPDFIATESGDAIETESGAEIETETPDPAWVSSGIDAATMTEKHITSVASGSRYQTAISYRSGGRISNRLILPTVVAGDLGTPDSLAGLINGSKPSAGAVPTAVIDSTGAAATVSIPAHTRIYPDKSVAVDAGTITGLALNTYYVIFYDDPSRLGGAVTYQASTDPDDALITPANPGRHYFGDITTPAAGSTGGSTGGGASGPGGVGGGGACPQEDEPILLANGDRAGPGETIRAADLRAGMSVWTRHEHSGVWGAYRVSRAARVESDLWWAKGYPRTSPSHLFWEGAWARMDAIGVPDGRGWVVQITVEEAHTYVVGGRLSHNKTTSANP